MRAWIYAFREGTRQTVVLLLTFLITGIVMQMVRFGFILPSGEILLFILKVTLVPTLFIFPVFVLTARYELWKNNRLKAK